MLFNRDCYVLSYNNEKKYFFKEMQNLFFYPGH